MINTFLRNFFTVPDDTRLAYLMALADEQIDCHKEIVEYRKFYGGEHSTQLSTRLEQFLGITAGKTFRLNQCPVVVEALVERLALTGFEEIGQESEAETTTTGLADFAEKILEDNRMDAGQEEIYRQAAIDHATYLCLDIDPSTGLITLHHNNAYTSGEAGGDGEGIKFHYATRNERGRAVFATKRWTETTGPGGQELRYFVIYYPDRIERYVQNTANRQARSDGTYTEALWLRDMPKAGPMAGIWPQPWVDAAGAPLGLPVVEFRNGRESELHEVVPIQRALNKAFIDLVAAGDMSAIGILFAAGWAPTSDGNPILTDERGKITSGNQPLALEPGAIFYTTNPAGMLTRVPGDDLTWLIQLLDRHTLSIAQVSRTPITNFQLFGQVPGSDTQKQLEGGLLAKTQSRQRGYGNAWEDLIYLARRVALGAPMYQDGEIVGYGLPAYEGFSLAADTRLSALWRDPQTRNEKELLETLQLKKELGVPEHQLFLEMGYDDGQADKFAAEQETRRLAGVAMQLEGANANNGSSAGAPGGNQPGANQGNKPDQGGASSAGNSAG